MGSMAPHLEDQNPSVRHRQAELGALAVLGRVLADAVHLQAPGDFQQLVVGHGRGLPAAGWGGGVNVPVEDSVKSAVWLFCVFIFVVLVADVFPHIWRFRPRECACRYIIISYCTVSHHFVLYCIICIDLYHIILYHIILYCIISYRVISYIVSFYIVSYHIE